jgi:hypothetical protein
MNEQEKRILIKIGRVCRNDWSGTAFDGRDIRDWCNQLAEGRKLDELEYDMDDWIENP